MLWNFLLKDFSCVADGILIVADGSGRRKIVKSEITVGQKQLTYTSSASLGGVDLLSQELDLWDPPATQKPVLLLSDLMGKCIPVTDSVIQVRTRDNYDCVQMVEEVVNNKLDLHRRFLIVWTGAQEMDTVVPDQFIADVQALVSAVRTKNRDVIICVSAVLPQPRNQHSLQRKINRLNTELGQTAADGQFKFLPAQEVYLDQDGDIVRPIVDNFEDGFHLNLHGAHRLRRFWLNKLGLVK